ncbi:hypothetical protein OWV82_024539 [Melia azedarach]|uniref:Uncharacterized protein n=1 Tax=Melia azedarach TaxID=155640 RepID=A0ACC1WSL2_MELAZ|nr:hypothetical protein OWV82_024539 [Melia azedarach]
MSIPGFYIADAYVLRKIHKEKMKLGRAEDRAKIEGSESSEKKNSSGPNISSKVKKTHLSAESKNAGVTDYAAACKESEGRNCI